MRRGIAEREAKAAKIARDGFEKKVAAARDEHARALSDAVTRRRAALDTLAAQQATPLNLARMANANAIVDREIDEASWEAERASAELDRSEEELQGKRDVLAQFLRREEATEGAIDRIHEQNRHLEDDADEAADE